MFILRTVVLPTISFFRHKQKKNNLKFTVINNTVISIGDYEEHDIIMPNVLTLFLKVHRVFFILNYMRYISTVNTFQEGHSFRSIMHPFFHAVYDK